MPRPLNDFVAWQWQGLFGVKLVCERECGSCNHVETSTETFFDLPCPVKGFSSVQGEPTCPTGRRAPPQPLPRSPPPVHFCSVSGGVSGTRELRRVVVPGLQKYDDVHTTQRKLPQLPPVLVIHLGRTAFSVSSLPARLPAGRSVPAVCLISRRCRLLTHADACRRGGSST